jgi:hypothetical protein
MVRPGGLAVPGARRTAAGKEIGSTNWSGYAVSGSHGAYRSVSATWTVPAVTCSSGHRYSSFWVGLDGYGSKSRSVEQAGTDADCSGRTAEFNGWYEMYPAKPVYFRTKVRPGDHLTASVTFHGTGTYTLVLKDSTRGWSHTVTKHETGLARSSAEVITEAPSSVGGVLPLADFGTVNYSGATANGASLASQDPAEIIMVDSSGNQEDSTSAIGSSGAFSNTWLRSS